MKVKNFAVDINEKAEEETINVISGQVAFSVMYQFVICETGL